MKAPQVGARGGCCYLFNRKLDEREGGGKRNAFHAMPFFSIPARNSSPARAAVLYPFPFQSTPRVSIVV